MSTETDTRTNQTEAEKRYTVNDQPLDINEFLASYEAGPVREGWRDLIDRLPVDGEIVTGRPRTIREARMRPGFTLRRTA